MNTRITRTLGRSHPSLLSAKLSRNPDAKSTTTPDKTGQGIQAREKIRLQALLDRRDYAGMLRTVRPSFFKRGLHDAGARKILLRLEQNLFKEAKRLLRKKDFKAAAKMLNKVVRLGGPLCDDARTLLELSKKDKAGKAAEKKGAKGKAEETTSRGMQKKHAWTSLKRKESDAKGRQEVSPKPDTADLIDVGDTGVWYELRRDEQKTQMEVLRRTPHMDLSPEPPLAPNDEFQVYVSVDTTPTRPGEETQDVVLKGPASKNEFQVEVTLVVSGHFMLREEASTKPMTIIRAGESAPVAFKVQCVNKFPPEPDAALSALFKYEGHPSGRVTRHLRVETGKLVPVQTPAGAPPNPPPPATLEPKVIVTAGMEPYNLTISIVDTGENDHRHYRLIADAPALGKHVDVPWNLPEITEQIVRDYMTGFVAEGLNATTRLAKLKGAGARLFQATPEEFRDLFWEVIDMDRPPMTIMVVSDEPYIPWELMVPRRKVSGKLETRKPLGVEFCVGRWIRPDYTSAPQQIPLDRTFVVAPNYVIASKNLKFAPQEVALVCASFNPSRQIDPADIDKINDALLAEGATLLHLICHGAASAGTDQTVYLRDMVNNLSCSVVDGLDGFVTGFPRDHTFVFLNACEVGRPAPALVGIGGLANTFLKLGASGVVAALWSVKDNIAHDVAELFYSNVIQHPEMPFAEILRDIRSKAYSGAAEDTYAAYCFYGSPLARRKV